MNNELPQINKDVDFAEVGFDLQDHNWTQRGAYLECDGRCLFGYAHGHIISAQRSIVRDEKGEYSLVNIV